MRTLLRRLWYLVRQRGIEDELAEEMESHRLMKQQDLEAQGVEPEEARPGLARRDPRVHRTRRLSGTTMNLSDGGQAPERFRGSYISSNALEILRVKPLLGRGFLPDDDRPGAPPVLILGHEVWQSRYAGDPNVIGRTVRVNDVPAIVVGIMPLEFRFPMTVEVWQPLQLLPNLATARRDSRTLNVRSVAIHRHRTSVKATPVGPACQGTVSHQDSLERSHPPHVSRDFNRDRQAHAAVDHLVSRGWHFLELFTFAVYVDKTCQCVLVREAASIDRRGVSSKINWERQTPPMV